MTSPGNIRDLGDTICDIYFSTLPSERWPSLLNFLDQCRAGMIRSTEGQRVAVLHDLAWTIGTALLRRDPSLQPHVDALLGRFPEPSNDMVARELGVGSVLQ
ncbi:hypothetical protein [Reyranella soli]|uniref:Uncharacterized protein n=1 Tax=Reyranella soli TaxID=1230389 RepID=A0A512NQ21_9HYPH|nr:hypothetical protein [Reyranella soli]GEP61045.1 hypothetical protein RSO01_82110 [Reyranella soli]